MEKLIPTFLLTINGLILMGRLNLCLIPNFPDDRYKVFVFKLKELIITTKNLMEI